MNNFDVDSGLRNFRDFLAVYNQMSESCFNRCVINLNQRTLSDEEKACTDVCAEKQMKFNNRLMSVYMKEQPLATERKLKEAEEQANTAMKMLKDQGVDVDNLTPEELAREAIRINMNK